MAPGVFSLAWSYNARLPAPGPRRLTSLSARPTSPAPVPATLPQPHLADDEDEKPKAKAAPAKGKKASSDGTLPNASQLRCRLNGSHGGRARRRALPHTPFPAAPSYPDDEDDKPAPKAKAAPAKAAKKDDDGA